MKLPIYKAVLADDDEGMDFNSWVDAPAHSKSFELFGKNDKKKHTFFDNERRIVRGVAIATDTPIYRNSPDMGEFYVYFDKETTFRIAEKMMANNFHHNVNKMHDGEDVVDKSKVTFLESFFVDSVNGMNPPNGLKNQNIKDGSWIVSYYVKDDKTWAELKSGKFTGFSIEVWMSIAKTNFKNQNKNKMSKTKQSFKDYIKAFFNENEAVATPIETKLAEAVTTDGVTISWDGDMGEGTEVFMMDDEGNRILAPEGAHSYTNEDGKEVVITLDANGIVSAYEEIEVMAEEEEEDEAVEAMEELAKENAELKKQNADFTKQIETLKAELDKEPSKPTPTKTKKEFNLTEYLKKTK